MIVSILEAVVKLKRSYEEDRQNNLREIDRLRESNRLLKYKCAAESEKLLRERIRNLQNDNAVLAKQRDELRDHRKEAADEYRKAYEAHEAKVKELTHQRDTMRDHRNRMIDFERKTVAEIAELKKLNRVPVQCLGPTVFSISPSHWEQFQSIVRLSAQVKELTADKNRLTLEAADYGNQLMLAGSRTRVLEIADYRSGVHPQTAVDAARFLTNFFKNGSQNWELEGVCSREILHALRRQIQSMKEKLSEYRHNFFDAITERDAQITTLKQQITCYQSSIHIVEVVRLREELKSAVDSAKAAWEEVCWLASKLERVRVHVAAKVERFQYLGIHRKPFVWFFRLASLLGIKV